MPPLRQHNAHMIPWLKARFGLTITQNDYYGFDAWMGDYDLDDNAVFDEATIMSAAGAPSANMDCSLRPPRIFAYASGHGSGSLYSTSRGAE